MRISPFSVITGTAIAVFSFAVLADSPHGASAIPSSLPTYRITDFGVTPNSNADSYEGMKRAAEAVCKTGGTLIYPAGTYSILEHRIDGGPDKNAVTDVLYQHCHNVVVSGYGAVIRVNGALRRTADYLSGNHLPYSYHNALVPFHIEDADNITIEGFELSGGVDQMSRDPQVTEGLNHGIVTDNCRHFTLKDLDIHHFAADGLYIGRNLRVADEDGLIENVRSHHNARQGLSILQAHNILVRDSIFSATGRTGSYGSHAPGAGVDVEPNAITIPPTSDIYFEHCVFSDNMGGAFLSGHPDKTGNIFMNNSQFIGAPDAPAHTVFLNLAPGIFTNNTFTVPDKHGIPLTYASTTSAIRYENNIFNLASPIGLYAEKNTGYNIAFIGNQINITQTNAARSPLFLNNLGAVENNIITFKGARPVIPTPVSFDGTQKASGNRIQ